MDFGKVNHTDELNHIDFKLPPDTKLTQTVLAKSKLKGKTKVYVGCAKWGRPDWVGKIYPPKTKAADFLTAYGKQFNCIELNAVYYQLPTLEGIRKWKSMVGKDFLFCPKFSDVITHRKRLKNTAAEVDAFLNAMYEFGDNLGPMFLMPHPQTSPKQSDVVMNFIDELPSNIQLFVEYRHPEWFLQANEKTAFNNLLQRKTGTVITDTAGRRDVLHMNLTTPHTFVRFVGNGLHASDYTRIDEWVNKIAVWMKEGLQSCYFFMHQHDELYSPELCKYLIEQLNEKCMLDIQMPVFYTND
jgi:uncharacterized protein YecE (DUF72 family)